MTLDERIMISAKHAADHIYDPFETRQIEEVIAASIRAVAIQAVAEERERCAKICESLPHYSEHGDRVDHADYAAAIRRGS